MTDDGLRCPSQDLDDEDSLFGSPPPSPSASLSTRAERDKSPALALPTSGSGASRFSTSTATGLQNVGTIALPGSHHDIELPMTPLALSLSQNVVTRPPALPGTQQKNSGAPIAPGNSGTSQNAPLSTSISSSSATPSAPSTSRGSSLSAAGVKSRPKSKKTHHRSRSSNEPTPQSRVEFELPDPSGPLPAHFLRNQDKLLGVAGLVGGVRPAAITHVRGTSASNPIIVDDDEDAPKLGRRPVQTKELLLPEKIDPSLLEAPSNEEIVSVLIRQKDIFPVLQSILKLIAPQSMNNQRRPFSQTSNRNFSPSSSAQPPAKKRKLNRVPAGAADWDVPYPFAQGEGPEEYRQTWERERSKQLITQLVKLIKTAAVKAATKKYVQKVNTMRAQEEQMRHDADLLYGDPPPSTPMEHYQNVRSGMDASNASTFPSSLTAPSAHISNHPPCTSQSLPSETSPNSSSAAFDHLISSLVAAQPHEIPDFSGSFDQSTDSSNTDILTSQSQGPIDQSLFDSWMDILQAFPVQFDAGASSNPSPLTVNTSFDMNFGTGMDPHDLSLSGVNPFGFPIPPSLSTSGTTTPFAEMTPIVPSVDELKAMASTMGDLPDPSPTSAPKSSEVHMNVDSSSISEHLINPQLMMLSMPPISSEPGASLGMANQGDLDVSLATSTLDVDRLSPLTSTAASSSGGTGPTTPASSAWDFSMPDFLNSMGTNNGGMDEDGGLGNSNFGMIGLGGTSYRAQVMEKGSLIRADKGKDKEIAPISFAHDDDFGDNSQMTGSTTDATTQAMTQVAAHPLEDAVFQSFFRRPPLFTPTVPLPTGSTIPHPRLSTYPVVPIPTALPASSDSVADRKLKREDILRRAKEKRQKLQEELNKVKTQLWETTVEQAGLLNLLKKVDGWALKAGQLKDSSSAVGERSSNT